MLTLPPPPHIQAAIAAACAAEDEHLIQPRATRAFASECAYQRAYQRARALAQRIGLTVPFQYNGIECFATPADSMRRA
jgi:hypothetical protein